MIFLSYGWNIFTLISVTNHVGHTESKAIPQSTQYQNVGETLSLKRSDNTNTIDCLVSRQARGQTSAV